MHRPTGLTLIELVVVLLVLGAVSALTVPLFAGTLQNANRVATEQSIIGLRDAMLRYWGDTKHVDLDGIATVATEAERFQIQWLVNNPVTGDATWDFSPSTRIGWRGPYLIGPASSAVTVGWVDAWGRDIEIQDVDPTAVPREVRIVSGGPNGAIDIPAAVATDMLNASDIGDDIYAAISLR